MTTASQFTMASESSALSFATDWRERELWSDFFSVHLRKKNEFWKYLLLELLWAHISLSFFLPLPKVSGKLTTINVGNLHVKQCFRLFLQEQDCDFLEFRTDITMLFLQDMRDGVAHMLAQPASLFEKKHNICFQKSSSVKFLWSKFDQALLFLEFPSHLWTNSFT